MENFSAGHGCLVVEPYTYKTIQLKLKQKMEMESTVATKEKEKERWTNNNQSHRGGGERLRERSVKKS